jgi:hypothetical protein
MTEKEAAGTDIDAAFRPILKISKDFHRSMQNHFYLFFSSTSHYKNLKTSGAWT